MGNLPILSSFDLALMSKEFERLKGARVIKFYGDRSALSLHMHKAGSGKFFFNVQFPSLVCIADQRLDVGLSTFAQTLRKYYANSFVESIDTIAGERLVIITFSKGNRLVLELFQKGNAFIIDDEDIIILAAHKESGKVRGNKLIIPKQRKYTEITQEEITSLLNDEKTAIALLVHGLGIKGGYLEDVFKELNLPIKIAAKELSATQKKELAQKVCQRLQQMQYEKVISYHKDADWKEISCKPIEKYEGVGFESKTYPSFSAAIAANLLKASTEEEKPKKIRKIEKIIAAQTTLLEKTAEQIQEKERAIEQLYTQYNQLQTLWQGLNEQTSWQAKFQFLESQQLVAQVKKKEKKIVIEL